MLSPFKTKNKMINKLLSRLGIEIWKNVPGYEGIYKISNLGRIKKIKYPGTNKIYYLKCNTKRRVAYLKINKIPKVRTIAAWMGITFLNHKPNGYVSVVDHIDNNKTNDRLYNLQIITQRRNLIKEKRNKSGYTGVAKNGKGWTAKININKIRIHLGTFKSPQEASEAYQKELNKL